MNKLFLAVSMATLGLVSPMQAQDLSRNQVPSVVVNEFQKQFPHAVDIDWERTAGNYEVEFEVNRMDHEVWYDSTGRVLKRREEIKVRSLPEALRNRIRQRYRTYRIMDAEKLIQGDRSVYKLELWTFFHEIDLIVDESGKEVPGYLW